MSFRPHHRLRSLLGAALATVLVGITALPVSAFNDKLPTIEKKTKGMKRLEGFFDLYWDEVEGKLFWVIERWDADFLYQVSLASGLGSNPVGLDRGQLGGTYVLKAQRIGPTVLLIEPNYRYRARSANSDEVRAVEEAFAPSTHWGFSVVAQTGDRALVDATDFFLRDAHGVVRRLESTGQGNFKLDRSRSAIYLPRTLAFPLNTEVETWLTFTSERPGPLVQSTAATGQSFTLRQHHSLVQLPAAGYEPRAIDPRVGAFGLSFQDWVARHRLQKMNPESEPSEAVRPIVYYLDRGVPEPVRSALLEGASWWNAAFEAAGFKDAFQVEMLPEGVDPMDLRYNMIHWTHRSTRGWSYGSSVVDPRTGEILKGNVNLGSLRLRQDHLLGRGMAAPADAGIGVCDLAAGPTFDYLALLAQNADPVALALARIKQLSAHEVGHTLGLAHNYIASTYGRASVMDYPAPLVGITNDSQLDLSDAYAEGVGAYDRFAIRWLYSEFPEGVDEAEGLEEIVRDGLTQGIRFISDRDARPAGAAHPFAALWDNGADPIAMLEHEIEVRRIGLEAFDAQVLRPGEPLSALEEVLVPLYLHHRYQVEAAAHSLGGAAYSYAVPGDGQTPVSIVSAMQQRAALDMMLLTVEPEFLAIPERILMLLPPRAFGTSQGEVFETSTSPMFDPLGVAASAADMTFSLILQPQRMARLVEYHARAEALPGLAEVIDRSFEVTWYAATEPTPYLQEIRQTVERVLLERLLAEAARAENTNQVRAILSAQIDNLGDWLTGLQTTSAHQRQALGDIQRWQTRDFGATPANEPAQLPPGSPIGGRRGR
jgi:hypothetical protein